MKKNNKDTIKFELVTPEYTQEEMDSATLFATERIIPILDIALSKQNLDEIINLVHKIGILVQFNLIKQATNFTRGLVRPIPKVIEDWLDAHQQELFEMFIRELL